MSQNAKISMSTRSGLYECSPDGLDVCIARYLPASPASLRAIVNERVTGRKGGDEHYMNQMFNVSELLIVLASFDYPPEEGT